MSLFAFSAALLTLAALFSCLNARLLRQPAGIMFLLMGVTTAVEGLATGRIVPGFTDIVRGVLVQFNFTEFLMGSAALLLLLLLREAGGGLLSGAALAYVGYRLIRTVDHFQTEVMVTLALVIGGYALCHTPHVSGPLAMVVAGLAIGNVSRSRAVSDETRDYLGKFW